MFRIEHNVETGQIIEIPLTEEEILMFKEIQKETQQKELIFEQDRKEKAAAKAALLAKLGITEEEFKLLMGGN